jgi:actin-related protein
MAAYGSGRTTALVIDFGEHKTDIIPVREAASHSVVINEAVSRINIGGAQLTDFMMQMLPLSG